MREFIYSILLVLPMFSCSHNDVVQISGRIENGDSIATIWVGDSIYSFPLDENDFFTGRIPMTRSGYGTLLHNSLNLYLSPGEDLEIYVNNLNLPGSLYFRGSLGGINNYLKEQEVAVFFDKDDYLLNESQFIRKIKQVTDEKIMLLEAKNFDKSFTELEKQRIRYSIAGRVANYPSYRKYAGDDIYKPGKDFTEYMAAFSLNEGNLFGTKDYRMFLLNYVYLQGNQEKDGNSSDRVADYIVTTVTNPTIRDFLLTEVICHYIWENNGLEGADYLLKVFRRECSDKNKIAYIDEMVGHWVKLLPGKPAPNFVLEDVQGNPVGLNDYKGYYVYITVWATWCMPCKAELSYLNLLQKAYSGKNIKFMTVAIDDLTQSRQWHKFLTDKRIHGIHLLAGTESKFNEDYMIISVPRFILVGPEGEIISSNAPRPSGQIRQLLDSMDL